jgi:hypothetical protein
VNRTGEVTLSEAIRLVMSAGSGRELFDAPEPARRYRELIRVLHPDRVAAGAGADPGAAGAAEAFLRLTELWRTRDGVTIRTRDTGYRLGDRRYAGDLADLYDVGADRLLKLPRDPANNDLMERERRALRGLADRGDPRYLPYVPRLVDSFRHRDQATGAQRRVNVLAAAPGLRPLDEVRDAYPDGLDARDVAWMWRRLLVALGLAHRAGIVHGAVLPGHVLIEPAEHGVVLVDWCYASFGRGDRVPAMVQAFADWYPAEVRERRDSGPGTDIAMATRCMTHLMDGQAPKPLRVFAAGCALPALRQRPDDAWRLLGELDGVLARCYGPRRFRPLHL